MARSETRTRLPLDRWAALLGLDPRHFNQVTTEAKPLTSCANVWKQYAWQETGQVSREDVALAIQFAERQIEDYVNYTLIPTWSVDERVTVTKPGIPEVMNTGFLTSRRYPMTTKTRWGHFISGGVEKKDVIEAGAAVDYTDEDGDDYYETATVTATIPAAMVADLTDSDEVAVYFPGESAHEDWEVRPLINPLTRRRSVTISGNTVTIVMPREYLVDPDLWSALNPTAVNGDSDAFFLATVDVYRRWNDPQQQVTLLWSRREGDTCLCGDTSCPTCAHSAQTGCLSARDYRGGSVTFLPALWSATDEEFSSLEATVGRTPDNLRLWYYSGLRNQSLDAPRVEMDPQWERAVLYLSLTYLTRPLCGCENVQYLADKMTIDLMLSEAADTFSRSYRITDRIANIPWGTMRGAVMAWQIANSMSDRRIGEAVAL